jgi:hypothetical protein
MTVCVATLYNLGRAIVLAADKMVGIGYVGAELDNVRCNLFIPLWFMRASFPDMTTRF